MSENIDRNEDGALKEKFDSAHDKVIKILESYILGGYIDSLSRLLVYIGGERAEDILSKMPDGIKEKVSSSYQNFSQKTKCDADIIAEAGRVLKSADFYGKSMAQSVIKDLSYRETAILKEREDEFFNSDPILALNIEQNRLLFEDIVYFDDRSIQKILREVEQMELAVALKNVDGTVRDKIFSNMSKRAASMLKEDMEFMGPVLLSDVEEKQKNIVSIINRLIDAGEIIYPRTDTII